MPAKLPVRRTPPAPKDLGPDGRRFWRLVIVGFSLDEPHRLELLTMAARAIDRLAQCRVELARDGLTVDGGRYGPRPHPCIGIERDQSRLLMTALAMLDLDLSEVNLARPMRRMS